MNQRLLDLVKKYLKYWDKETNIDFDMNLKDLGLDSIASIQLLIEIEDEFDIEITDEYLTDNTFSTISSLRKVVEEIMECEVE